MAEQKKETTSSKAEKFVTKNAKVLIVVLAVVVCGVIGYILGNFISSKSNAKALSAIDNITYELTKDSAALEATELDARRATAFEQLAPYAKKGGVVGVRANMLCADLAFQQEKFEASAEYWTAVVAKSKKSYTAPIANYNLGVCYEQLGKTEDAAAAYKKAADAEDFTLRAHAAYSYGRALEAKGDYKAAVEAYNELNNRTPDDTWAKLAKTRVLVLKVEGKAE